MTAGVDTAESATPARPSNRQTSTDPRASQEHSGVVAPQGPSEGNASGCGVVSATRGAAAVKSSKQLFSDDVTKKVFAVLRDDPLQGGGGGGKGGGGGGGKGGGGKLSSHHTFAPKHSGLDDTSSPTCLSTTRTQKSEKSLCGYTIPKKSCPTPTLGSPLSPAPVSPFPPPKSSVVPPAKKEQKHPKKKPSTPHFQFENGYPAPRTHMPSVRPANQQLAFKVKPRSVSTSSSLPSWSRMCNINSQQQPGPNFAPTDPLGGRVVRRKSLCEPVGVSDPKAIAPGNSKANVLNSNAPSDSSKARDSKFGSRESTLDTRDAFDAYDPKDEFDAFDPKLNVVGDSDLNMTHNTNLDTLDTDAPSPAASCHQPSPKQSQSSPRLRSGDHGDHTADATSAVQIDPKIVIRRELDRYFDKGTITNRQYKRILERASRRVKESKMRSPVIEEKRVMKLVFDYVQAYKTVVP